MTENTRSRFARFTLGVITAVTLSGLGITLTATSANAAPTSKYGVAVTNGGGNPWG